MEQVDSRYGVTSPEIEEEIPKETNSSEATKTSAAPSERKKKHIALPVILAVILLLLAVGVGVYAITRGQGSRTVASGVTVSGLDFSGMTKEEASQAISAAFDPSGRDIVLTVPGQEIRLSASDIDAALDSRSLLTDILALEPMEGASAELSVAPYLSLDDAALYSALEEIAQQLSQSGQETTAVLEGDIPDLSEDGYSEDAAMPTLAVTLGTSSYSMDVDAGAELVFNSLASGQYTVDLADTLTAQGSIEVDAEAILEQVSIQAVDAAIDSETKTAVSGSYGMGYDSEELQQLLDAAQPGETVRVTLEAVAPEVMGQEVYFQDVLGFGQTPHGDNEKRNTNLKLACAALNGVVLQPGETLSYNATLGQRTEEAGYQEAPAYSGTELVDSLGGGVCQVSSTLYLASLYAELDIVERVNHGYPASYMPVGLDATVNWGTPDLKITNSTDYPIKIVAEECDGYVRVWLMGTETRDYYVRMAFSSSSDGYARSYYCRYDNETDELISKEEAALSGYLSIDTPIVGEIGSGEVYVNGNVRQVEDCEPTEETLEESKNYKEANTRG